MMAAQPDLFVWLQSERADHIMRTLLHLSSANGGIATIRNETTAFIYLDSRDLTGFIDGSANPAPDQAPHVALVADGPGAGGSYVSRRSGVTTSKRSDASPSPSRKRLSGERKLIRANSTTRHPRRTSDA